MYLPSDTPILTQQRQNAARHAVESDARIDNMRRTSACGRARLFNTLVAPNQVADAIGMGTGLDAAKLQAQTETSRATGILGTGGQINSSAGPTVAEIIAGAPEVVSLNRGGGCSQPSYQPVPLGPDPTPGMPARAPNIVQGPDGPMYYRGQDATFQGNYPTRTAVIPSTPGNVPWTPGTGAVYVPPSNVQTVYAEILNNGGLTGYAPPWADAGVLPDGGVQSDDVGVAGWLMDNPWLALALAGAGVYALSRRSR